MVSVCIRTWTDTPEWIGLPPKVEVSTPYSPCVPNVMQIAMIGDDLVVLTGSPQVEEIIKRKSLLPSQVSASIAADGMVMKGCCAQAAANRAAERDVWRCGLALGETESRGVRYKRAFPD